MRETKQTIVNMMQNKNDPAFSVIQAGVEVKIDDDDECIAQVIKSKTGKVIGRKYNHIERKDVLTKLLEKKFD